MVAPCWPERCSQNLSLFTNEVTGTTSGGFLLRGTASVFTWILTTNIRLWKRPRRRITLTKEILAEARPQRQHEFLFTASPGPLPLQYHEHCAEAILLLFLLKYRWFIMCSFQVDSKVIQFYDIYFFKILFHYSLLQASKYTSLCYKVGTCSLPILYIEVYIC